MKRCLVSLFTITLIPSAILFTKAASSDISENTMVKVAVGEYVPAQIVVKFEPGVSQQNIDGLAESVDRVSAPNGARLKNP